MDAAPWLTGSMKLGRTWLKVERAIHHLIELRGPIARIESGPYELVEIRDAATGDRTWVLRADDAAQHVLGLPMYGVIVGDFVHNLRSALDHAVWKLAQPPIAGKTGFPICLHERGVPRSFHGDKSKGIRPIGPDLLKNVPNRPSTSLSESSLTIACRRKRRSGSSMRCGMKTSTGAL